MRFLRNKVMVAGLVLTLVYGMFFREGQAGGERLQAGSERVFAGITFCWCPPGNFLMGSPESERWRMSNETKCRVTLTEGFWIPQTPCTQAQYQTLMGVNPVERRPSWKGTERPVVYVTWNNAVEYCNKLSALLPENLKAGLPTEAQWEYACRARTTGPYNVDGVDPEELGWFQKNANYRIHPVKQKKPNAWNIYDMHGHVWEWCANWYQSDLGVKVPTDPTGPKTGEDRAMRGGCWYYLARTCRSAFRGRNLPNSWSNQTGFRPILIPKR